MLEEITRVINIGIDQTFNFMHIEHIMVPKGNIVHKCHMCRKMKLSGIFREDNIIELYWTSRLVFGDNLRSFWIWSNVGVVVVVVVGGGGSDGGGDGGGDGGVVDLRISL